MWVREKKKEKKQKTKFSKEDRQEMKAVSNMFGTIRYISGNKEGFFRAYYSKDDDERQEILEKFMDFAETMYR